MRIRLTAIWALFFTLTALAGCAPAGPRQPRLVLAGSTSVQPLVEVLAEAFQGAGGGWVTVQGGGSTAGVRAVQEGVADLGMISRRLTPQERAEGLTEHLLALDVLAIAVHPRNPLDSLSLADLRDLFSGRTQDWAIVGGAPGPVYLFSREAGSGSREAFRALVGPVSPRALIQPSSGAIRAAVMRSPGGVGYLSYGAARLGGVKLLTVAGRRSNEPGYPLVRPLSLVSGGPLTGPAGAFLRHVKSPAARRLIESEGFVPAGLSQAGQGR